MPSQSPKEKVLAASLGLVVAIAAVAVIAVPLFIGRAKATQQLRLRDSKSSSAFPTVAGIMGREVSPAEKSAASTGGADAKAKGSSAATISATGNSAGAEDSSSSASPDAPGGGSGGGGGGDNPPNDPPAGSEDRTAQVTGRIVHAVWGTPLAGVQVTLGPTGRSAVTDGLGFFTFSGVPADTATVVSVASMGSEWLSYQPSVRTFLTSPLGSHRADFELYSVREASGRDWRDAASWRAATADDLGAPAQRVGRASSAFAGLSGSSAVSILDAGKNGNARERARAELLAAWLDLATGRLGFDTAIDLSGISGSSQLGSARTALPLVRAADALVVRGEDVDWNSLRRSMSPRVIASAQTEPAEQTAAKEDKRRKK